MYLLFYPDEELTDMCDEISFDTQATFLSSPKFPDNYPPDLTCACVVTSRSPGAHVVIEVVHMAIKFTDPCRDWLRIGSRRMCGTSMNLFTGRRIPIELHTDGQDSHSGFWLYLECTFPAVYSRRVLNI